MDEDGTFAVSAALLRLGLIRQGEKPRFARLTGGVSSDIWLVETANGLVCVKRALAKLRVQADWYAPIERNAFEAEWRRPRDGLRVESRQQVEPPQVVRPH